MFILGLVLIGLAVFAIIAAIFAVEGDVAYLGFDVAPLTLFVIGAATVVLLLAGSRLTGVGARRELHRRKESRQQAKQSLEGDRASRDPAAGDH